MTRKNIIARMVSSNNKIVSSRFFEQSQFEQMIMSHIYFINVFVAKLGTAATGNFLSGKRGGVGGAASS
jgi:hypothetical protein